MPGLLMGVDCGSTMTKAVVCDAAGRVRGSGGAACPRHTPAPRMVERDMDQMWAAAAEAIASALEEADCTGGDVAAVGCTGHGDGLYLINERARPVGPGILSLDSRAATVVERWRQEGIHARALELSGQCPSPATPAALLAWLSENDPMRLERAHRVLGCKDWIKLCLTGEASTDPTEASQSFTNVATQRYDPDVLALYGLEHLWYLLAPVVDVVDVAGHVTPIAAQRTGLATGTPVVAGMHDVDASALGSGCLNPAQLSIVAGTYSINQIAAPAPALDPRWACRTFAVPGQWLHMAVSPASSANIDWSREHLRDPRTSLADRAAGNVQSGDDDGHEAVMFLPFLYGSPFGSHASGAFLGLRAWHGHEDLLRAVTEGVTFNHRTHVDALRERFTPEVVRLTGGAARDPSWAQMLSDALALDVEVPATDEAGCVGVAMAAAVGAGLHDDLPSASVASVTIAATHRPRPKAVARLDRAYRRYLQVNDEMQGVWRALALHEPSNP